MTQDVTGRSVAARTAASASPADPSRLPTDVASATTRVDRSSRNQFITVAEVERTAAEKERREQVWHFFWQGLTAAVVVAVLGGFAWFLLSFAFRPRVRKV
jgi:imidazoleglycerol phosphate dehydratase HisB